MKPAHQILSSELERLFSVGSLRELCTSYLGVDPERAGIYDETKAVFARRLTEHCVKNHSTEALVDTMLMLKRGMVDPRIKQIYEERFPVSDLAEGTRVDDFEVERKVGDGALGAVYLAKRTDEQGQEQRFGIKVIRAEYALDPYAVARFTAYMRFLSTIDHPAVPKVEATGQLEDGRPYVVTQWFEGTSLDKKRPLGVIEALDVIQKVIDALEIIHERGLVHGDLNLHNLIEVKDTAGKTRIALLGLGTDRLIPRADADADIGGRSFGSFYGIAPEQARGKQPDARSDIYALGAALYELVAGQPLFSGRTPIDIAAAHLRDEPRPLGRIAADRAASALEEALSRMLAKESTSRPHDLLEVRKLLEAAARKAQSIEAKAGQVGSRADIEIAAETLIAAPTDAEALELLRTEAKTHNAWPAAVEVMEEAAVACSDQAAARALLLAATRDTIEFVKDYDKAQELLSQVLSINPEDPGALATQLELLRAAGRYEDLIAKLAQKAEQTEEPSAKLVFIEEISELYETGLSDSSRALDYGMACIQPTSPDERLLSRLEKLADRSNRFADLAATTANAASLAEAAGATEAALAYYRFTGTIYLERLDQSAYALTCFQKVLAEQPADLRALEAVADLYRGAQQWAELAQIIGRLGEVEKSPDRSRNRMVEAAQILHERLSDTAAARATLESVLSEDPAHKTALSLLTSLLEKDKEWDKLARVLSQGAEAMADGPARAETYLRLAEIEEDRRDDLKAAALAYQAALKVEPRNLVALKGLERVYARQGDNAALRANLELQLELVPTPKQKVLLLERLADIYEEEFKDLPRAIDALRAMLELDNEHRGAMVTLTRLFKKTDRFEDLAAVLEQRASTTDDLAEKRELLTERATVIKEKLGDPQRAAKALAQVASLGDESALDSLARTQEEAGDFEAAAATIRKMIDNAATLEAKVDLSLRLADLEQNRLGLAEQATETLQRVRTWAVRDRRAIAQLRSVYVAQGNFAAAIDLLDEELTMVEGSAARAQLIAEMGVIAMQHIRDEERAIAYFERALELDENNLTAGDNVSTIYRLRGQWEKAMPIYRRWADAAGVLTKEKRIELFTQMGEAFDHLGQRDEALKAFSRAADVAGNDPHLIRRLGEVALEVGELAVAKSELGKYLELAGESLPSDARAAILVKLSRACLGTGDVSEAAKLARQAGAIAPDSLEARVLLADVHEKRGDFRGMVEAATKAISAMDPDDERRLPLLRRVSSVQFEKLKDGEGAANMLQQALSDSPNDRGVLNELLKIYTALKRFDDVIRVVLRLADLVDDPAQQARYFMAAAKIYRRELNQPEKGVEYFEKALEQDPTFADARVALVELLSANKEWERLEKLYKKTIASLPKQASAEDKLALYEPLADLLSEKLDRPKDAVMLHEAILKLAPENMARMEKLGELYGWKPEYADKAISLHRRMLEQNPARVDSLRMLYRICSAQNEPDGAFCAATLLAMLNQASPEERAFYREHRLDDVPTLESRLKDDHWNTLVYHPSMNQTITSVFSVITRAVMKAKAVRHSHYGLDAQKAMAASADTSGFGGFLGFAAGALGIEPPPLFFHPGEKKTFELIDTDPLAIIAPSGDAALKDRMGLAFQLGQALTLLRPGLAVRKLVPSGTEMSTWLLAAIKIFVPTLPLPGDLVGAVTDRVAPIRESLSNTDLERLQGHVQAFVSQAADVDLKRWAKAVDMSADRAGLLLCGDVSVAVRLLKASIEDKAELADRLRALSLFVVSEEHLLLRKRLGTALKVG